MRTFCTALVLVVFAAAAPAQDKKFESKDGRFSAKFPGEPETKNQKAGNQDLSITIFESKDKDKKGGYAVIYSDMTPDAVKAAPAKKLLENGEKGLIDTFKAKVVKSAETTVKSGVKEYPARDIVAEKENLTLRLLIVLADNRLYQVFVVGPKEVATGKEADDFLKSFEVAGGK